MARRTTIRVTHKTLAQDREVAKVVLGLKDYNPANKEFTIAKLQEALARFEAAEQAASSLLLGQESNGEAVRPDLDDIGDWDVLNGFIVEPASSRLCGGPSKASPPS